MTDTKELRETIDCSTQGTWVAVRFGMTEKWVVCNENGDVIALMLSEKGARAVAASLNAMPGLLVEVERERWVPVGERLPEEEGYYLANTALGSIERMYFAKYPRIWIKGDFPWEVTHWRPLPKPPEGV